MLAVGARFHWRRRLVCAGPIACCRCCQLLLHLPSAWHAHHLRPLVPTTRYGSARSADRAAVLKALDGPAEFECKQTPLSGVIKDFEKTHHLEIQLGHKALEEAGIDINSPVTFKVPGTTVRQALDLILRPLELTWEIRDGALKVTTVSEAETLDRLVIYPVEDLLFPAAELRLPGREYVPDYESLIELMTRMISPTTWREGTGPARCILFHGAIIVRQTRPEHEEIADMLSRHAPVRDAQFANEKSQPPNAAEKSGTQRATDAAFAALHKLVKFELVEATLDDLVKQVYSQCKVPAAIDAKALEEAGIEQLKVHLTRKLKNVSLHATLDQLLEGTEMTWAIQDGVLLITTESQSETLYETRVYPIRDLGEPISISSLSSARPQPAPLRKLRQC